MSGGPEHMYEAGDLSNKYTPVSAKDLGASGAGQGSTGVYRDNKTGELINQQEVERKFGTKSSVVGGWGETNEEKQAREDAFAADNSGKRAADRALGQTVDIQKMPNEQIDQGLADRQLGGFNQQQGMAADARGLAQNAYNQQNAYAQALAQQAAGNGPSAAQALLKQNSNRSMLAALAMSKSGRNPGIAQRQAMFAGAQAQQAGVNDAAMLRAQEQQAATQQLGSALGQMAQTGQGIRGMDLAAAEQYLGARGQDIGVANANMGANIQQNQYRQNMLNQLNNQRFAYDSMARDQRIQKQQYLDQMRSQQEAMARNQWNAQQNQVQTGVGTGLAALGAVASLAAASDERVKENITDGGKSLDRFLSALSAKEYNYKEPDTPLRGHGKFVSAMAQDLEKTELGKAMVKDTPNGKVVDYGKGLGTMLAAMADQHKRIKKLEGDGK